MIASHLAAFVAGAAALALLLLSLPAPPPSPSSVPSPENSSFFSIPGALDALCEVPRKRILEARSGRGYFEALDDAAAALPPALHATLLLGGGAESTSGAAFSLSKDNCRADGRLIFVGDVHGCADELESLMSKVDFDKK